LAGAFWSAVSGAMGAAAALLNLLLIPVAAAYLLNDFDRLNAAILRRVPPRRRESAAAFAGKIDAVLWGFVRGQLTVAVINALILSVGLTLVGAPMGLFIGLAAGLAGIVPYLMVVVGLIPALVLSYLSDGGWLTMALVVGVFALAQALEGVVISPWALEKAVGLHPVAVMAALLIGGMFFGFLGVLLAVPAAAALKVALAELDAAWLESEFYNHPGAR
ncbi:MAG: AI-2E family transporter, partial [Nitrospinae bacterium]|nr:AI-2E family transporter [Nitrospinota bacterium]